MQKESVDLSERVEGDLPTGSESAFEAPDASWDDILTSGQYTETNSFNGDKGSPMDSESRHTGVDHAGASTSTATQQDVFSNMTYFDVNNLPPMDTQNDDLIPARKARGSNSSLQGNVDLNSPQAVWGPSQEDGVDWKDEVFTLEQPEEASDSKVVMSQWHSCAICLEEYPEHQLLTHKACGGVLCHACMEVCVGVTHTKSNIVLSQQCLWVSFGHLFYL